MTTFSPGGIPIARVARCGDAIGPHVQSLLLHLGHLLIEILVQAALHPFAEAEWHALSQPFELVEPKQDGRLPNYVDIEVGYVEVVGFERERARVDQLFVHVEIAHRRRGLRARRLQMFIELAHTALTLVNRAVLLIDLRGLLLCQHAVRSEALRHAVGLDEARRIGADDQAFHLLSGQR